MASTTLRYIIVLPTFGAPYLLAVVRKDKKGEALSKGVDGDERGDFAPFDRKQFVIHPMFVAENRRWAMAEGLRQYPHTMVWVNEAGIPKGLAPNMATVLRPEMRVGGCPHLLGDIVLDVPANAFKKLNINPECLKLAPPAIAADGKVGGVEPEDDEEMEKFEKEFEEKGWDYNPGTGAVYLAKA